MSDPAKHLRALERAASEAQRVLEIRIAEVDSGWSDSARRSYEADHLAAIRGDARRLRVDLDLIAEAAEQARRDLSDER
jgi:hypothetical protein